MFAKIFKSRWLFRIFLAGVIAVALGYLPYQAYGPKGVGQVVRMQQELEILKTKNGELHGENQELLNQVRGLNSDPQAIQRVARDELGLVRRNDVVFLFEKGSDEK